MYISQQRAGPTNQSTNQWLTERKFDTALRKSTIEDLRIRLRNNDLSRDDHIVSHWFESDSLDNYVCDTTFLPYILSDLLTKCNIQSNPPTWYRDVTKDLFGMAKDNINIQFRHMMGQYEILNRPTVMSKWEEYMKTMHMTNEIQMLFAFQHELNSLIEKLEKVDNPAWGKMSYDSRAVHANQVNSWGSKLTNLEIRWSSLVCIMKMGHTKYILPRPCLQELHNKVSDLLSVLIYVNSAQHGELPSNSYNTTVRFVKELCTIHINENENFFAIAKSLESLVTAEILREVDSNWIGGNYEFLQTLSQNLKDSINWDYHKSFLETLLKDVEIPLRNELGCLSKITGHPFVDMEIGSEKLFDTNNSTTKINLKLVQDSVNVTKLNYVKQYLLKRKSWPPCFIEPSAPSYLHEAKRLNLNPEGKIFQDKFKTVFDVQWMQYLELLPDMRFDFLENFIPQLKDRSISALKTRVMESVLSEAAKVGKNVRLRRSETRLLLYFITNVEDVLDHIKYIEKYTYGELEELKEYLVIRIVPKEKELKPEYRGFGCTSYQERARKIVQEKNVKRVLAMYVPEQAMTTSELELARKLMGFRRLSQAYPGYETLFINIDSSKWNSKFREEAFGPVMRGSLDHIFGYPIFSKTMQAYHHTLFYVPDGRRSFYWEGQLGGIEGLNQDSWVYIYVNQIHTAMRKYGQNIPYFILCKGDDVRIAILIAPYILRQISLSDLKNELVSHLEKTLKEFGHTIKPDDSYGSGKYLTFSKHATIGTIGLPTAFRKIQKVYGANNAMFPILDDYIASTFSNAHSSAHECVTFTSSYFVALVWAYYYLINDKTIQKCKLTYNEIVSLLLIPSNLGGFPVIYLINMPVRSESDHLPLFIHLTQFCATHFPHISFYLKNFLYYSNIESINARNIEGLFADIYSLPVKKPSLPLSNLMKKLEETLKAQCVNETILSLFKAKESSYTANMLECLFQANIYDVKIIHNIYAALPGPMLKELLALFESSKSIMEALLLTFKPWEVERMFNKVLSDTRKLLNWRIDTLRYSWQRKFSITDSIYADDKCPALIADELRTASWGKPVINITMPPMTHFVTYTTPAAIKGNRRAMEHHWLYDLLEPKYFLPNYDSIHYASGKDDPFVGYVTPTGTLAPTVNIVAKDMILQKVKNLIDLIPWCQVTESRDGVITSSNLQKIIERMIFDYTGKQLSDLSPFAEQRRGGTIAHHVRARDFRESIIPNDILNRGQLVSGKSNSHIQCRLETVKRRINFLQVYCHSIVMLTSELDFSRSITTPVQCAGVTIDCDFCWSEVKDLPIIIDESFLAVGNPFGFGFLLAQNSLDILEESLGKFDELSLKPMDYGDNIVPLEIATLTLISELIDRSWEDKLAITDMYSSHLGTEHSFHILRDVTGYTKQPVTRQGELKSMPAKHIASGLMTYIYSYLVSTQPFCTHSCLELQQLIQASSPTSLPWVDCVAEIYRSGRLADVLLNVECISNLTPPMCYNYTGLAAQYIGVAACEAGFSNKLEVQVCDYQYLTAPRVVQKIQPYVDLIKFRLCTEICESLIHLSPSQFGLDKMFRLSCVPFIITSNPLGGDEIENYVKANKNKNVAHHKFILNFVDGQDYNPVDLGLPYPAICTNYPVLQSFKKTYPSLPWNCSHDVMMKHSSDVEKSFLEFIKGKDLSIPVYITLIDQCIKVVRAQPSQLNKRVIAPKHELAYRMNTRTPCLNVGLTVKLSSTTAHDIQVNLPNMPRSEQIPTYGEFKNKIDTAYWSKVFGRSNSAAIKILSIICEIVDFQKSGTGLSIACVGEGQGGVLGCLSEVFPKSNFIYVSLPEGQEPTYLPDSAYKGLDSHDGRLLADVNTTHITDLRDMYTIEALVNYNTKVDIYVCDAQTDKGLSDLDVLHSNVLKFIYETHSSNFAAIIKVDVSNTRSMIRMANTCTACYGSVHVFLCKPPGSQVNREAYLVLWGLAIINRAEFDTALESSMHTTYTSIATGVKEFQNMVIRYNTKCLKIPNVYYMGGTIPSILFTQRRPSLFIHSFLARYFVDLANYFRHHIRRSRESLHQILKTCCIKSLDQAMRQNDFLVNPNLLSTTSKAEFNTLIRRIYLATDLYVMFGFNDTLEMIREHYNEHKDFKNLVILLHGKSEKCLKALFLQKFSNTCSIFGLDYSKTFRKIMNEPIQMGSGEKYQLSLYENYITGIHGAMTFLQSLLIVRNVHTSFVNRNDLR